MTVTVFYVGSSLPLSLRRAEREINEEYGLGLRMTTHNCTLPLSEREWAIAERDLATADIVFVIHVTDSENTARLRQALDRYRTRHQGVIVINCLGDLMRRTRIGGSDFPALWKDNAPAGRFHPGVKLARHLMAWFATHARNRAGTRSRTAPDPYLKLLHRLPSVLRLVPTPAGLSPIKHYLMLFCYFLQPTPANIRSMVLYAVKHCLPGYGKQIEVGPPETAPATGIYHPDAPSLFETFEKYRVWYESRSTAPQHLRLDPERTVGLLLLRPQVVGGARRHYDAMISALEAEGLAVIAALSTFMDNRTACRTFFVGGDSCRVSQILSLTGFSFVGGPAGNDSEAAVAFLRECNRPLRSAFSLEMQTIESWAGSTIGLNPVQTAMQIAIPEIDGATEPFLFGGTGEARDQPEPLEERCRRIAVRLARWNRLRRLPRSDVRLAFLIFCFPPTKGNLGTAAGLDVFPSLWEIFRRLGAEGYKVHVPETPDALRELLLEESSEGRPDDAAAGGHLARVAYRLAADEYYRLCPYVEEIEAEWGPAPGSINTHGSDILIHGIHLGNIFVGVQPTFGYEGDPMRLLMAHGAAPHHGFMGLYTYLEKICRVDAVIHVGTHGSLEFMPGKQAGLSSRCWPDRLIGSLPHIYLYSVNNPSEGTIAKRRGYAELVSYLTPPIENAGLYKELASLKELLNAYRQSRDEKQREQLFAAIEEMAEKVHLWEGHRVASSSEAR